MRQVADSSVPRKAVDGKGDSSGVWLRALASEPCRCAERPEALREAPCCPCWARGALLMPLWRARRVKRAGRP